MMENRGFDHYFGTLKGVRGFGDRHPVPLESGKPVWFQSDGTREIPPYHLDTATTSAMRVPGTPHSFRDAQAAWNQGKFGFWPKFKTQFSMGHYRRADLPYQFALAEAFTICDAYHCSVTTGTDPNRIMFWSGTNADPAARARGRKRHRRQFRTGQSALLDQGRAARAGLYLCRLVLHLADHSRSAGRGRHQLAHLSGSQRQLDRGDAWRPGVRELPHRQAGLAAL